MSDNKLNIERFVTGKWYDTKRKKIIYGIYAIAGKMKHPVKDGKSPLLFDTMNKAVRKVKSMNRELRGNMSLNNK